MKYDICSCFAADTLGQDGDYTQLGRLNMP